MPSLPSIPNPTPTTAPAAPALSFTSRYQTVQHIDSRLPNGPWPTTIRVAPLDSIANVLDGSEPKTYQIPDLRALIAQFPVVAQAAGANLIATIGLITLLDAQVVLDAATRALATANALPDADGTKAQKVTDATAAQVTAQAAVTAARVALGATS